MDIKGLLIKHEGFRNKPYRCPAGKNTIGVGWNFDDNPLPKPIQKYLDEHGEITDEMVDQLLDISIAVATEDCRSLFPEFDEIPKDKRAALIDWCFQVGKTKAKRFVHFVAAVNTGRWDDAGKELKDSNYYKQVPVRAAEIIEIIES